ncbi:3-phosphoshikimate 1-carboxyvinyltransferase [Flammeovirga agarivorans]|uniref:3-phosphoshikimate 1-carboxyvinyltransferase n=1 Tax=Flammeovirga agarivorans TaxID=2726742 RepID=A0A7X8XYY1_9BACT|nr:3-phosphoshikimate 1-carboxyvinyltransferase [Flammeovirga agarivorans]NLR94654.1 3-phosphoshikimate 1-carboxyvinyltransferase [Flammeovirga agarivorans]
MKIFHPSKTVKLDVPLVSSKSESNRALIIQASAKENIELGNISKARDTQTMMRLLASNDETLDVLDAGTTMRFLTAYVTANNRKTIMTGTARMQERPIGILVDALRSLGADVEYLKNDGYPPHKINGFTQKTDTVSIRGDVSSQYISALLLVGPTLPQGIKLVLEGTVASKPYIMMTLSLMERFGVKYTWEDNTITVAPQEYKAGNYTIESDWSGASYWYSIAALSEEADIKIMHLREDSLQGDKAIVEIMEQLGVKSTFEADGVRLTKTEKAEKFFFDFTHCPDLAQTIVSLVAALGMEGRMIGLQSLRIKETDRIAALQNEIKKLGLEIEVIGDEEIIVPAGGISIDGQTIHTYEDHRMAMAFAPLSILGELNIDEPEVVAKSYPSYWEDLTAAGFKIED